MRCPTGTAGQRQLEQQFNEYALNWKSIDGGAGNKSKEYTLNWKSLASANGNRNLRSTRSIGRVLTALMGTEIQLICAQLEEPCQR
jgi:hypothetical protein